MGAFEHSALLVCGVLKTSDFVWAMDLHNDGLGGKKKKALSNKN